MDWPKFGAPPIFYNAFWKGLMEEYSKKKENKLNTENN